jgi:hypothetical protein
MSRRSTKKVGQDRPEGPYNLIFSVRLGRITEQELELVAGPPAKQPRKCHVRENNSEYHLLSIKLMGASHHLCGLVGLYLWFGHNVNACIIQNGAEQ